MFGMGLPHGCRSVAKAPLSPSDSSPNKLGERSEFSLPQLVGEGPEGGWGPSVTSLFAQEHLVDHGADDGTHNRSHNKQPELLQRPAFSKQRHAE